MEEQTTIVSLHEHGNIKTIYDKGSDFCSIHALLQPSDPWEDENTSLSYEDCNMKDNCEGHEFTPSLSVSGPKINAEEGETMNDGKGSFGSDTK